MNYRLCFRNYVPVSGLLKLNGLLSYDDLVLDVLEPRCNVHVAIKQYVHAVIHLFRGHFFERLLNIISILWLLFLCHVLCHLCKCFRGGECRGVLLFVCSISDPA